MDMENGQVLQAIEQVKLHCVSKMPNYEMVSMRGALYDLGYNDQESDQVIRYVANHGFDYCLDPMIAHEGNAPSPDVCYWGPDQLLSRLECL